MSFHPKEGESMEQDRKDVPSGYEAPAGTVIGNVVDLTAGKDGSESDGYGGCNPNNFPSVAR
jgi:hypothetical protein